ncbi:16090_t:CDS:1, partial [Cetraspora pellucida]
QQHSPRCLRNGTCIYYYPKPIIPETYINERGYVQYRRRTHDDAWVVPYNPMLIMKLECHINFEISSTVHLFMYLYKYLFKGPDYVKFTVNNADTTNFNNLDHFEPTNLKTTDILPNTNHQSNSQYINEFNDYIKGRYLSAPEAA